MKLFKLLSRYENGVDTLLSLLSMVAVVFVVSTQFVSVDWHTPLLSCSWGKLQTWVHTVTWLVYVGSFAAYMLISGRPIEYVRKHILELVICVAWIPNFSSTYPAILNLTRLVPLDILQLVGCLAHAWKSLRFIVKKFNQHPVFVAGSAGMLVIAAAASFLTYLEPKTFPSFWDASWFSFTTITTIGFGDYVPHTAMGRFVTVVLVLSGVGLFGVFIGLVSEMVRNRLFKKADVVSNADLQAQLADQKRELEELKQTQAQTNSLLELLLQSKDRNDA